MNKIPKLDLWSYYITKTGFSSPCRGLILKLCKLRFDRTRKKHKSSCYGSSDRLCVAIKTMTHGIAYVINGA